MTGKERHMGDTARCCPVCLLNERRGRRGQYGKSWMQELSVPPSSMCLWHESGAFLLSPALTSMGKTVSVSHARWLTCMCCTLPMGGMKADRSRGWGALAEVVRVWIAEEWIPPTRSDSNLKHNNRSVRSWFQGVQKNLFSSWIHLLFLKLLSCISTEFNLGCFCVAGSKPLRSVNAFR